ncbi:MAG: hypothetical protein KAR40_12575 [Candidatus Sabulitectum sp.]|nr:hypothetical protein [Candidatus Sabulitectum sp.]
MRGLVFNAEDIPLFTGVMDYAGDYFPGALPGIANMPVRMAALIQISVKTRLTFCLMPGLIVFP